jgi:hypothetical protein
MDAPPHEPPLHKALSRGGYPERRLPRLTMRGSTFILRRIPFEEEGHAFR